MHRHVFCRLVSRWRNARTQEWACLTGSGGTYWLDIYTRDGHIASYLREVAQRPRKLVAYLQRSGFAKVADKPVFCNP